MEDHNDINSLIKTSLCIPKQLNVFGQHYADLETFGINIPAALLNQPLSRHLALVDPLLRFHTSLPFVLPLANVLFYRYSGNDILQMIYVRKLQYGENMLLLQDVEDLQ